MQPLWLQLPQARTHRAPARLTSLGSLIAAAKPVVAGSRAVSELHVEERARCVCRGPWRVRGGQPRAGTGALCRGVARRARRRQVRLDVAHRQVGGDRIGQLEGVRVRLEREQRP